MYTVLQGIQEGGFTRQSLVEAIQSWGTTPRTAGVQNSVSPQRQALFSYHHENTSYT
jgi:hypothetical protein